MTVTSSPTAGAPDPSRVSREILAGDSRTLAQVAEQLPEKRSDRKLSPRTVKGYIVKGITTPTNKAVKLEAARFGRTWLTSSAAVHRFLSALLEASTSAPTAEAGSPPGR